ncbi:ABC transporter substrate-binding protein [Salinibacterium sp. ZJ454]|uniref:ABC transporter substrate-binding protein n=1 Tax=Salinibacterium sp. ZJ454 TaxID=2708339 RepID=UPI001422BCAC|nr:ABC transporter substrate-binding protein [Salinibacterium sp. ZJ454]
MKIGKKRLVAAVAAVAAISLALAGCSSDGEGSSDGPTGEPIKVGMAYAFTSTISQMAEQAKNAVQLAVDTANEEGGIGGRPIELVLYDTEYKPELAQQLLRRAFTADRVTALLGPAGTGEGLAVSDLIESSEVPSIQFAGLDPRLTEGKEWTFRVAPVTPDVADGVLRVAKALDAKDIVLIRDDSGFTEGAVPFIYDKAEGLGVNIETEIKYTGGATDFTAQVGAMIDAAPDAVIISGQGGSDHGNLARAMVDQGLMVPLIGFSGISYPDAIEVAGEAYNQLPGVYTVQAVEVSKPEYKAFVEAYSENWDVDGVIPEIPTQAYDAMKLLIEALKVTEGEGGEALADALRELPDHTGAVGRQGSHQKFIDGNALQGVYLSPYRMVDGVPTLDEQINYN